MSTSRPKSAAWLAASETTTAARTAALDATTRDGDDDEVGSSGRWKMPSGKIFPDQTQTEKQQLIYSVAAITDAVTGLGWLGCVAALQKVKKRHKRGR